MGGLLEASGFKPRYSLVALLASLALIMQGAPSLADGNQAGRPMRTATGLTATSM